MPVTDELDLVLSQRTWDKELNLWVGPERQLRDLLAGVRLETLDLLDLIADDVPTDADDIRLYLSRAMRQKLRTILKKHGQKIVLIVLSAALLATYRVGVREFYEWFCDDFSMAFLVIEGRCTEIKWPEEIECQPNELIDYFRETPGLIKRQLEA